MAQPAPLGRRISLYDHALSLHTMAPDTPLPHAGEPYPDHEVRRGRGRPRPPKDRRAAGADVAVILDRHFADPDTSPGQLNTAFHDAYVPIHPNEHVAAAALRAERLRVQQTGRWLVQYSDNRYAGVVGLALLAAGREEDDIPLAKTIGLLSDYFGPLAANVLQRRVGGAEALMWLGQRVTGWGRVYVVEALCRNAGTAARRWLLRSACDGGFLDGYFAGEVAITTPGLPAR